MNWHDAADAKLDLWRFWNTSHGERMAKGFAASLRADNPNSSDLYDHIHQIELSTMHRADPIWVDPEIMDVVEVASETFQPEPFVASDLITPCGFVLLPRAVFIPDARGRKVSFRAFSWHPAASPEGKGYSGVWMSLYSHTDDIGGEDRGVDLKKAVLADQNNFGYSTPWIFLHGMIVEFGMTPAEWKDNAFHKTEYTDETMNDAITSWWRFVQTLLRLSMQNLSKREEREYPRAVKRRFDRANMEADQITVITLRRSRAKTHDDGEGEPVHWQNRWIVGGHWRNQWFPSLELHRQIYIAEHIKGPEDKPLVIRKGRVFNFVR